MGDTLWLGYDYIPYFHPMVEPRIFALQAKGYRDIGIIDMAIVDRRPPYPVPDSIYWSQAFRDSISACASRTPGPGFPGGCGTWGYRVSRQGQKLSLVLLDSLSRAVKTVATHVVLMRDSLVNCNAVAGCDYPDRAALHKWIDQAKDKPIIQSLLGP